jgi:hypothetical protein
MDSLRASTPIQMRRSESVQTPRPVRTSAPNPQVSDNQPVQRQAVAPTHAKDTRKKITDTDDMLARIDRKMEALGVDNPDKREGFMAKLGSRVKSFGKALAVGIVSIPRMVASSFLSLTKAVANIPRLFTYPMKLVTDRPDKWMKEKLSGMNEFFNDKKKALSETFDGINARIIKVEGLKSTKAPDKTVDGKMGDGPDGLLDGAMGIVNVRAGVFGTNVDVISHGINNANQGTVNAGHTGEFTTLNDGDKALDMGAAPLVLATGNVIGQMDEALTKKATGKAMIADGREQYIDAPVNSIEELGGRFLMHRGRELVAEGDAGVRRGNLALLQNGVGAVNMVAGSTRHGAQVFGDVAVGVTNVTQLAGFGLTAVAATYDAAVDGAAAHSGRKRKNRCDDFLGKTAEMHGSRKVVESLDTSVVRDGVKLFRKNQSQNYKHKALSSTRNVIIAGAAVALLVATTAAVAATPVGWGIMGAAAVGAVGFGLYKTYKSVRRQENIQRIDDRLARVQDEITKMGPNPQSPQDRTRLEGLKKLEHTIQRYQRQTDPTVAADAMINVLNNGKTPEAKRNAAIALSKVFKIDSRLFMKNAQGQPYAGPQAYAEARELLQNKMGLFA